MASAVIVPANRKGGIVLLQNNFRYVRNRTRPSKITWRCTEKSCGAIMQTNHFDFQDVNATIKGEKVVFIIMAPKSVDKYCLKTTGYNNSWWMLCATDKSFRRAL
jgi:hypothetical protein